MPSKIEIIEVGPRDGLQNENQILAHSKRTTLVKKLSQTGLKRIELGAFVSPYRVPQMEDSLKVAKACLKFAKTKNLKLQYSALVPNKRGLQDFLKTELKEAALFAACTETFSKKNINCSIEESFERFKEVADECKGKKIKLRGYLSTVFGCPFEGEVSPKKVVKVAHRMLEVGAYEISLGDTIGVASPKQVKQVLKALLDSGVPAKKIAGHYHDTRGTALANVIASIDMGITKFDASVGGLGGCPYAPGAAGNLASEDLVYCMNKMGIKTGVDLKALIEVARWLQKEIGHPISSHLAMTP
jgi:hydroxymethylglutaryl-CoA lyase